MGCHFLELGQRSACRVKPGWLNLSMFLGVAVFAGQYLRAIRANKPQAGVLKKSRSSLRTPGRHVCVVTTAALPWRTGMYGTAVNPLLRVAYLEEHLKDSKVMFVVPWLSLSDQRAIFPDDLEFNTEAAQAEHMREWARQRTGLPCNFEVVFYSGRYFPGMGSIFATVDIIDVIPRSKRDIVILEEPEHLTWFQHRQRWSDTFNHVVGIVHTNYLAYVEGQPLGLLNAAALERVCRWVCRMHCHKVIKLSDAVQDLPRQVTCNVHGVAYKFVEIGRAKSGPETAAAADSAAVNSSDEVSSSSSSSGAAAASGRAAPGSSSGRGSAADATASRFAEGAYFIGKAVWGKGYRELLQLLRQHQQLSGGLVRLDVFGSGEDLAAIQAQAAALGLSGLTFAGGKDHADPSLHEYKVFVNPSISDVVATTTAEALAMGKWVIVDDIPCNVFFKQFPNCLTYTDAAGFSACLTHALSHDPAIMSEETLDMLSWDAATERLLDTAEMSERDWPSENEAAYDRMLWRMWRSLVGIQILRQAIGMSSPAPPGPMQAEEATPELQQLASMRSGDLGWIFAKQM